jgi:hypothetical protein
MTPRAEPPDRDQRRPGQPDQTPVPGLSFADLVLASMRGQPGVYLIPAGDQP